MKNVLPPWVSLRDHNAYQQQASMKTTETPEFIRQPLILVLNSAPLIYRFEGQNQIATGVIGDKSRK